MDQNDGGPPALGGMPPRHQTDEGESIEFLLQKARNTADHECDDGCESPCELAPPNPPLPEAEIKKTRCNYDVQALVEQLQGHEGATTLEFIQRQMTNAETRHQFATSTRALDQENLVKLSSKLQAVQRELNAANEAASHEHERANRADAELSLVKGQLQTAQHNSDHVLQ